MNDPWFTSRQIPRNWKGWLLLAAGLVLLAVVVGWMEHIRLRGIVFGVAIAGVVSPVVAVMLMTSDRPKP